MKYKFSFDKNNSNQINVILNNKIITIIACPPINNGCDIISFGEALNNNYTYNFKGLILITTKQTRKLFYKGQLKAKTKRNLSK